MSERYSVRYGFNDPLIGEIRNDKTVLLDTEDAAERFYGKVIHHAANRPRPLHGTVALWDGKWLVKSDRF